MAATLDASRFLRFSPWDGVLVGLSLAHAAVLFLVPSIPVVAIGLWWNANTIAHNFIHTPFFTSRRANVAYSIYLSAVLGIPQTLWRDRHLAHHAGRSRVARWTPLLMMETGVILALWVVLGALAPGIFFGVYLPGYLAGLGLCFLQGHYEHARGTTSHYGRIYNLCFFNDGYHVEHHRRPGEHWTRLPRHASEGAQESRWPPVLRWLDAFTPAARGASPAAFDRRCIPPGGVAPPSNTPGILGRRALPRGRLAGLGATPAFHHGLLDSLERLVLRSSLLQRFVLAAHERALREMLSRIPSITRVTIVGGGLFPRTALILQKLLPEVSLTVVERRAEHIEIARRFLDGKVDFRQATYDPAMRDAADLIVIPLSFAGDRRAVYRESPAPFTLIHDWMWNQQTAGVPVSWLLLKRLNLVTR